MKQKRTSLRFTAAQIIYAALMSMLLLGYLAVIAVYSDPTTTGKTFYFPGWVWILRLVTAGLAVILARLWKDKGFWILMAYLFLKLIRVAIPDASHVFTEGVSESLLTGIWVFCGCYGMAKVFSRDQLKLLLYINVIVVFFSLTDYSLIVVVNRDRKSYLSLVLSYNVFVKNGFDLGRGKKIERIIRV